MSDDKGNKKIKKADRKRKRKLRKEEMDSVENEMRELRKRMKVLQGSGNTRGILRIFSHVKSPAELVL